MSDNEKKSGVVPATGSVVVEQTADSKKKQPYRPTELQDEPTADLHHKRSKVPAVPSLAEELKDSTIHMAEEKECDRAMSSEKHKHSKTKIISTSTKKRDSSPETITLAPLEVETKGSRIMTPDPTFKTISHGIREIRIHCLQKGSISVPSQPIPAHVDSIASTTSNLVSEKVREKNIEKKADDDSITEEVAELRTTEEIEKRSEWSDDEEAGGLPRSESRASRASRAMRQLFCCGVQYEAPSEDNISSARGYATGI